MRVASVVTTEKKQMHAAMRTQAYLTTGQRQVDNMARGIQDKFILAIPHKNNFGTTYCICMVC
jgi:hypothetical protein